MALGRWAVSGHFADIDHLVVEGAEEIDHPLIIYPFGLQRGDVVAADALEQDLCGGHIALQIDAEISLGVV